MSRVWCTGAATTQGLLWYLFFQEDSNNDLGYKSSLNFEFNFMGTGEIQKAALVHFTGKCGKPRTFSSNGAGAHVASRPIGCAPAHTRFREILGMLTEQRCSSRQDQRKLHERAAVARVRPVAVRDAISLDSLVVVMHAGARPASMVTTAAETWLRDVKHVIVAPPGYENRSLGIFSVEAHPGHPGTHFIPHRRGQMYYGANRMLAGIVLAYVMYKNQFSKARRLDLRLRPEHLEDIRLCQPPMSAAAPPNNRTRTSIQTSSTHPLPLASPPNIVSR